MILVSKSFTSDLFTLNKLQERYRINREMNIEKQGRAPIYEALEKFRKQRVVPFDVPGHKRGRGNPELTEFLGQKCLDVDVNSMKPLDNLSHPVSVIKEAEELAADAFGAAHAFLMVGGTTSSVQAMVLSTVAHGDKIIMPRNVHKSAINALILCGAVPVYIDPKVDKDLGIPLGMEIADVKRAIESNPDAKAILINNPSYYGICSDLKSIIDLAHEHGMKALVDEAHGTHLYFHEKLPPAGMQSGADMAAVSMHKSGGSLTQSSLLLTGDSVDPGYVQQIINLTQSTSASYLLLASLDISRRNLALRGHGSFENVGHMAEYARNEINEIGGYYAFGSELINGKSIYDFDITKLVINTRGIGLTGIEVYDLLRDEYDIQMEFGELSNVLAYISIGDRLQDIERLAGALADIKRLYQKEKTGIETAEYVSPVVRATPQEAFYSEKETVKLTDAAGRISGESVMCYPPGIPIVSPGELITDDIITYINEAKERGCSMQGTKDPDLNNIEVLS
jgi:arginine/lysine/ornithine decarboxylase